MTMKWARAVVIASAAVVATAAAYPAVHGPDPEAFVPLTAIRVPIVDSNHVEGTLNFRIVIAARNAAAAGRVEAAETLLRSRALSAGLEFSRLYATSVSTIDTPQLAAQLEKALKSDNDDVDKVLLVEVRTKS